MTEIICCIESVEYDSEEELEEISIYLKLWKKFLLKKVSNDYEIIGDDLTFHKPAYSSTENKLFPGRVEIKVKVKQKSPNIW
jgi:hypothetical protein